jgi:hypothetical protein
MNLGETIPITFNFQDRLLYGETVTGAACTCVLFSGTDPNPSAMLSGSPTVTSTQAVQNVTGGIVGNIYVVSCAVTTSGSHNYICSTRLAVITPGGKFAA